MKDKTILIGDAGGTNTEWSFINGSDVKKCSTMGFNAFTHSLEDFAESIKNNLETDLPDEIHIYCAGADTIDQKNTIATELSKIFKVKPVIENDLLGAARATCKREKGFVCILGTGANASYYDGLQVEKVSASLGYVLGDEGSGSYLGKALLRGVYRSWFDQAVIDGFNEDFQLPVDKAITTIYNSDYPNKYLASFVPFISKWKQHSDIEKMIMSSFESFFHGFFRDSQVDQKLHFVGSIAFHFSELLKKVADGLGYQLGNIVQSPMEGLIIFHQDEQ